MDREQIVQAAVFDFVAQWDDDRARGVFLPLSTYLSRYPECEDEVAREFLRLETRVDPRAPARGNHEVAASRYRAIAEIARGGMGRILRVRDGTLDRDVAMKVSLASRPGSRHRLAEEAHVTGELDHPGVVPVHDMGEDAEGRSFFTMRLVEGRDLREIIGMVRRREEGWSVTRALEVLLKVCDTLAYAHSRGVVHRDLKPSNIRVGGFGEVYVLDWGLAKSNGRRDETGPEASPDLHEHRAPALTLDGDVIGTPYTMSPEQAGGRVHEIGPRSDVYSAGAMLYEILSGQMPYLSAGESPTSATILDRVRSGSLVPLRQICRAPAELVSICEKAMARDPEDRYPDMREMASDLRAYLELRVVRAHGTGAWAALAKWVRRNRWLSIAIASVVAISTAAAIFAAVLQHRNEQRLRLVADSRTPKELVARFAEIQPDVPERIPAMEAWLAEADDLLARREGYETELATLQAKALPWSREDIREKEAEEARQKKSGDVSRLLGVYLADEQMLLAKGGLTEEGIGLDDVRARIASLKDHERKLAAELPRLTWRFTDSETQFRHDTIEALLPGLVPLIDSDAGEGLVSKMRRRLEFARSVEFATKIQAGDAWREAIASIQDRRACPAYKALVLRPQMGLVPIRRDPRSGLWEFLHAESGEAPSLNTDGSYRIDAATGIVLVLVPGGGLDLGAQSADPRLPNFDPAATPSEWTSGPKGLQLVHWELAPFFLSKYEMTQAQWRRITGRNPSQCQTKWQPQFVHSETHPVELVTWTEALQIARQVGLDLPAEAQWEYAARAGTRTPWWTGVDRSSLAGAANLVDRQASLARIGRKADHEDWPELDDGFALHAPVGSYPANAFGLHDVCGNASEWCRDPGATSYDHSIEWKIDTGERIHLDEGLRAHRGGSFTSPAAGCRSAARAFYGPLGSVWDIGLRPSRALDR
jgi:formylglycine-generating enzyme required for sulfatase activity